MKPPLDLAGPADSPVAVPGTAGITKAVLADTIVIPYNDPAALERVLAGGDVACFIVEPVMENIGICRPDDGYLQAVREITARHGTLLIFDEVKTGITAGYGGATGYFGVEPDLVTLAKSIGGGFPVGAFGGRQELMDLITAGNVLHLGTYNGNPLVMAAARAVLAEACAAGADRRRHRPQRRRSSMRARRSSTAPTCPPTRCASAPRAASRGRGRAFATTATTRPPTSTSPSPSGSTASTAASCCHPASTSSG